MVEYFKVSSGLKNLIGSELITDNYIAVFELVKNAFDASAKKVIVRFENNYSGDARIIIMDDGKGMDYSDLIDKWLFVAYSAKRDGTEDYRNNLKGARYYAGNKGVGRFSCDRLGSSLRLITVKNAKQAKIESLKVNWRDFEVDQKEEFYKIAVIHDTLEKNPYPLKHGTILEISGVKDGEWDRDSFLKLKDKLSKLIQPNINVSNKGEDFQIILEVPEEEEADKHYLEECKKEGKQPIYRDIVNGQIQNFIFGSLNIKTTKIISEIIEDRKFGSVIKTKLIDRDIAIYEVTENNTYEYLRNVDIHLYFLNRAAKRTFTLQMGIEPVNFGNLFVYKNGFRVHPFGDPRTDPFGIDSKATQHRSNLPLRNLIGQVDIFGDNPSLRETTSRDGGLIKNNAYIELEDYLFEKVLKRLQKYVVDVTEWGVNDETLENLSGDDYKKNLAKFISNVTTDKELIDIWYNKDILQLVETKEENSAKKLVRNFKRIASETNNNELLGEANKIEKRLLSLQNAKAVAEKEAGVAVEKNIQLTKELEDQITETLFAKSILGTDTKEVIGLQHQIDRSTDRINRRVVDLVNAINRGEHKNELLSLVEKIGLENKKIATIAQYVTRANFNLQASEITADLISYIKEYVHNVFKESASYRQNHRHVAIAVDSGKNKFKTTFRPLEIIIILDNLFSNSVKAGAKNINIILDIKNNELTLRFIDDGKGVSDDILPKLFTLLFTTTRDQGGSGIGLYQVKQVIERMKGKISVNNKLSKGTEFLINVPK
ncbi:ATP-binding protein [Daejeonella sp. JGW-45]|uniref:sensor histidine kinase n=1 Tax=Daejeonella sp. JGW-45 TaxID=3034148 RepID=UPI0023EAA8FA|nr:ATP-binding protein [Daejeonella sp. JGW-45]